MVIPAPVARNSNHRALIVEIARCDGDEIFASESPLPSVDPRWGSFPVRDDTPFSAAGGARSVWPERACSVDKVGFTSAFFHGG